MLTDALDTVKAGFRQLARRSKRPFWYTIDHDIHKMSILSDLT